MNSNQWFLYVVECSDGTLYTGITKDLTRRINEHNYSSRSAKYTRSRRPVKLVYSKSYTSQSEALKAEYRFKRLKRKKKLEIIDENR